MAWSDAARAAALEARRMHAKAKKVGMTEFSQYRSLNVMQPIPRWALARDIKALRRAKAPTRGYAGLTWGTAQRTMEMAVASTKARNANRGYRDPRMEFVSALRLLGKRRK